MTIQILGTGGAYSDISTSYLINDNTLVDCGESVIKTLINKNFISNVLDNVNDIYLTHSHSDHVNGLEMLLYYKMFKNQLEDLTMYGTQDCLDYLNGLAISKSNQFTFVVLPTNGGNSILHNDMHVSYIKAEHMDLKCLSYIFVDLQDIDKKFIITGDMDSVNEMISPSLIKDKTYLFHDMGWTGLPEVPEGNQNHPREQQVYDFYGDNKNIIGIHTDTDLEYYEKAVIGQVLTLY
jgi:ribonuclease BN (tRNA processing enzyme)